MSSEVEFLVGTSGNGSKDVTNRRHETTLIVFDPAAIPDVRDFRSFVQLSWRLQLEAVVDHGHGEDLQLVLFHPEAKHDTYTASSGDAADYTIRSPFPTVHLLREMDVMQAVTSGYPELESLPARNKAKLRKLGVEQCASRLDECYRKS